MFKKARNWFVGLSNGGKIALAAAVVAVGVMGTTTGAQNTTTITQEIAPKSSVEVKVEQATEPIVFEKTRLNDGNRDTGNDAVINDGVDGVKTTTYEVTYTDGKETNRAVIKAEITKSPVSEVTSVGTRQPYVVPAAPKKSACDPNYSGACVPIASDVDCEDGSGNGPVYVSGPVYVVGKDIYDLDGRDNDGIGCE